MVLKPVAYFRCPLEGKFGLPRQAGLASALEGEVVLEPEFKHPDALRGLEGFDYLWLIWGFHLNREGSAEGHLTVRPPRLGDLLRTGQRVEAGTEDEVEKSVLYHRAVHTC